MKWTGSAAARGAICATAVLLLAGAGSLRAEESPRTPRDDRWNDTRLLEWVSTIGGPESDYDDLATVFTRTGT